jgi:hypothetical protein
MAPILGIYASQISGHLFAPSGAYDSIATTTVGAGGAATVTFSSIPSTYTHLQIRGILRHTPDSPSYGLASYFNGDTGSNYSFHTLQGDGASATGIAATSQIVIVNSQMPGSGATANAFGAVVIDVLDYANTNKFKTSRSLGGWDGNGSGYINLYSGNWRNTAAVTSISLTPFNDSFAQYTQFALYGIKGN